MLSKAFTPFSLGGLTLKNRFVKPATYEGMAVGGVPSASLMRHHAALARGGVALTTVAYGAVDPSGKTFAEQLTITADATRHLAALTDAVHRAGGAVAIQLAHAGGFSKDVALRGRRAPLGPSFGLNPYGVLSGLPFVYAMREGDMRRVRHAFVAAAKRARDAGFDAVELHLGHGYLLSQFLSPAKNRRRDAWGGSLENRMRFPMDVVSAVRDALGPTFPVLAKQNLDDGVRGGLGVDEAVEIARELGRRGVSAIELSGGLVTSSAMYLLRGGRPLSEMVAVEKSLGQKVALAAFGPFLVRKIPFEPLFFLDLAKRVRAAVDVPLVLLGGVATAEDVARGISEGFELVALGRALLHDPELVAKLARGERPTRSCSHCNVCITEMDRPGGVACVEQPASLRLRDTEVRARLHLVPAGDAPRD